MREVRLYIDSLDNAPAAIVSMDMPSGGWDSYNTYSAEITETITGKHTVYVVFNGGKNLNWYGFDQDVKETPEVPEQPTATPAPTATPVPTTEPASTATPTPTTSAQNNTDNNDNSGSNTGLIVGIVIAVVVIGGAIAFVALRKK